MMLDFDHASERPVVYVMGRRRCGERSFPG